MPKYPASKQTDVVGEKMENKIDPFDPATLNQLARAVAEVVTHREVAEFLAHCSIAENGGGPRWQRLVLAWSQQQAKNGCANAIIQCAKLMIQPVRFINRQEEFDRCRDLINRVLAFAGISFGNDGLPRRVTVARSLGEAQRRADSLHSKLEQRLVHPDIMRFCRGELLQENYFHAILEASKSVAQKLRDRSGLTSDGADVVDGTLGGTHPMLAINTLQTETEKSEQRGFVNLLKGIFGTFRNVTAHAPKVSWAVNELDALDMLSLLSYVHRRLDVSARTRLDGEHIR